MVAAFDTGDVYEPRRDPLAKIRRRLVRHQVARTVPLALARPIVSITFDDVPESALVNALPLLEARGLRATLYVATGLMGTTNHLGRMMDAAQLHEAHERGHEIAAHTHSHRDFAQLPLEAQRDDLAQSESVFAKLGLPQPRHFAWPYGECSRAGKRLAAGRYTSLRGIAPKVHRGKVDLNQVGSLPLFHGRMDPVMQAIKSLEGRPGWVTLFTHDVRDTPSDWGMTPAELEALLTRLDTLDVDVLPVGEAVTRILRGAGA